MIEVRCPVSLATILFRYQSCQLVLADLFSFWHDMCGFREMDGWLGSGTSVYEGVGGGLRGGWKGGVVGWATGGMGLCWGTWERGELKAKAESVDWSYVQKYEEGVCGAGMSGLFSLTMFCLEEGTCLVPVLVC
ncbi:hypothetical protein Tco_0000749 [Tanacetum coccineum]